MSRSTEPATDTGSAVASAPDLLSRLDKATLGIWGFYFTAKLALYGVQLIGFHAWANLAFVVFILIPVEHAHGRRLKQAATVLLAIVLLYYDSWLPPIGRVLSQASLLSGFSSSYLLELAGRFISLPIIAMLIAAGTLYWLISRWIRMEVMVIIAIVVMTMVANFDAPHRAAPLQQLTDIGPGLDEFPAQTGQSEQADQPVPLPDHHESSAQVAQSESSLSSASTEKYAPPVQAGEPEQVADNNVPDTDKALQKFFVQESARAVSFSAPKPTDIPFDVIFIHVCSLSWDDLKVTGLDQHPLWKRFDILLTRFNSVSTYSGPAAIRMQRATCGQSTHTGLYSPAAEKCYLMDSLKRSGFEPGMVLNHDGHFDDFLKLVQTQGRLNVPPMSLGGALVTQHAFDNSPIYEDRSVLTRWLEGRQKSNSPRIAMYYNTVSLHDGNHLDGANAKLNSRENYKLRLSKLLDDLDGFMQDIEKSGRRAVVAMIPEHGAALRGDRMQISGLREIPSPAITLVPVGIKVIGANFKRSGETLQIGKPTSFLAVSHIVAGLLKNPPYAKNTFFPSDYVADLPLTPFVAQNEDVIMAGFKGRYYLRQDASGWVDYTDF